MVELIIEVLKKEKNKLFRTLLLFCIVALFLVEYLPDNEKYPYKNILIAAMPVILAMLIEVVGEAIRIKLPRAKNKMESILFVIDTEDELYYRDVKNKFVKEFEKNSYYQDNKSFHAICINQNKLKCRELSDKNSTIELLKRVNCIFLVRVTHRVNSLMNGDYFELSINYAIMHPELSDNYQVVLNEDIKTISPYVKTKKYEKSKTIESLRVSAISLDHVCKYLIGLIMLFMNKKREAYDLYHGLKEKLVESSDKTLLEMLNKRLYAICLAMAYDDILDFNYNQDISILEDFNNKIEEANLLVPDTYDYYLHKAYYYVARFSNIDKAKQCIERCKEDKGQGSWKYSDAFIAAYEGATSMHIYRKYQLAFREAHDLLRIVNYIEFMIKKEPSRTSLYLAAGLVYNALGERILSKQCFDKYFSEKNDLGMKKELSKRNIWYPDMQINIEN